MLVTALVTLMLRLCWQRTSLCWRQHQPLPVSARSTSRDQAVHQRQRRLAEKCLLALCLQTHRSWKGQACVFFCWLTSTLPMSCFHCQMLTGPLQMASSLRQQRV